MLQKPKHEKIEICNLSGRFGDPCGRQGDSVVSRRLQDNQEELAYYVISCNSGLGGVQFGRPILLITHMIKD